MEIGINCWSLPAALSLAESFALAARSGFSCVEINLAEEGEVHPGLTESEAKEIAANAEKAGVKLTSVSTGLGWQYPLSAKEEEKRERGKELIRAQLKIASLIGADTILVVPAVVSSEVAYDEAYERSQQALKELAPYAESLGVAIGVENVWNRFLLSPLEFAHYIDEIDSPMVGAYFDAGNVLQFGFPDQWVRILGSRIKKVHIKDFKSGIGNISGFCNPLQGDVPWDKVKAALDAAGYSGPITAEVDGYRTRPEIGLRHIAECMKAIFTPESVNG